MVRRTLAILVVQNGALTGPWIECSAKRCLPQDPSSPPPAFGSRGPMDVLLGPGHHRRQWDAAISRGTAFSCDVDDAWCLVSGEYPPRPPKRAGTPLNAPETRLEWAKGTLRGVTFQQTGRSGEPPLLRTQWTSPQSLEVWRCCWLSVCVIPLLARFVAGLGSELTGQGQTQLCDHDKVGRDTDIVLGLLEGALGFEMQVRCSLLSSPSPLATPIARGRQSDP